MMFPPKLTLQSSRKAGFHLGFSAVCGHTALALKCFSVLLLKTRALYFSVKDFFLKNPNLGISGGDIIPF